MEKDQLSRKLAVILHADVVGSTSLVQRNETLAHGRIQATFQTLSGTIKNYGGIAREIRGDALVAEFDRASDAVAAAIAFQAANGELNTTLNDDIQPQLRIGISLGEVIIADNTITGAGVVLAQRLEQLADPGGVVVQGSVSETVPTRMPFEFVKLGEQLLKGFDDPVRVYQVVLSSGESIPPPQQESQSISSQKSWQLKATIAVGVVVIVIGIAYQLKPTTPMEEPATIERMAFPLPDKPSIAVLPFANMSDDAEQEYFVDGMTEDLITDLSKLSGLFVIARNSVFTYKNKPVKVRQVAEELGVRYILEGSVRRAGEQIRVNAQLIDATTGGHLWAERYDRRYVDIFSLQDELTSHIVAALALQLTPIEKERLARHETESIKAYELFLQGWAYYEQRTKLGYQKAEPLFKKAIELDPNYSRAHAALAANYWLGVSRGAFGKSKRQSAEEHLRLAMMEPTTVAHRVASLIHTYDKQHNEATAEAERAIALDPNDPVGYFAMNRALTYAGRPAEAIDYIKKAMRLNPHYPPVYLYRLGFAQFNLERYNDAAASLEESILRDPDFLGSRDLLVATYGHLNRISEAKAIYKGLNEKPDCSWYTQFKKAADQHRWCQGLQKAGF